MASTNPLNTINVGGVIQKVSDYEAAQNQAKAGKKIQLLVDIAYIDFAGEKHATRAFMQKFAGLPENILTLFALHVQGVYILRAALRRTHCSLCKQNGHR